jgi:peptide/nickel transport system permease protein
VSVAFTARRTLGVGRPSRLAKRVAVRSLGAVIVVLASTAVTFFALKMTPGDPVRALLGGPTSNPTPATIAAAIKEFGLDKPLVSQYAIYLGRLLHGNLGMSFSEHMPVAAVLGEQIWPTLQLTAAAMVLAWILALISVAGTAGRGRVLSGIGSAIETISAALRQFWLSLVLLSLFAFGWEIFPPEGDDDPLSIVLPTVALALPLAGFMAQVMRESFELALDQPFVISARMRGLSDWSVRLRHVSRHAILPAVGLSAWAVGSLIGNSVLIEVIFSRQGLGRELYQAVSVQDMPLTIGITLFITVVYVIASTVADALYLIIDPRLQVNRQ